MRIHQTRFGSVKPVSIFVSLIAGVLLLQVFCSSLDAADSAAISLEVTIPEYYGVHISLPSVSMASMIGGKPGESTFSVFLSSTGDTPRKLTGRLAAPLPEGLSMTVEVSSPHGGKSAGPQALGTGEVDLVTGFRGLFDAGCRGILKMKGSNSLSGGQGQAVLVLAVRDM